MSTYGAGKRGSGSNAGGLMLVLLVVATAGFGWAVYAFLKWFALELCKAITIAAEESRKRHNTSTAYKPTGYRRGYGIAKAYLEIRQGACKLVGLLTLIVRKV